MYIAVLKLLSFLLQLTMVKYEPKHELCLSRFSQLQLLFVAESTEVTSPPGQVWQNN